MKKAHLYHTKGMLNLTDPDITLNPEWEGPGIDDITWILIQLSSTRLLLFITAN
jgi:hypothetical protein